MEVLKQDKSGACYVIFPDCPLIDFPNVNYFWVFSMIAFGQNIARPLRLNIFGMREFLIFCLVSILLILCIFLYLIIW